MSLIKLKIKLAGIQWPSPFNPFFFLSKWPLNASGTRNRGWVEGGGEGGGGGGGGEMGLGR